MNSRGMPKKKLFFRTRNHLSLSCCPTVADYETPIHLLLFIIIGLLFIALQAYSTFLQHTLSPLVGSNYYYYIYIFFYQITLPHWSKLSPYIQLLLNFSIVDDLGLQICTIEQSINFQLKCIL